MSSLDAISFVYQEQRRGSSLALYHISEALQGSTSDRDLQDRWLLYIKKRDRMGMNWNRMGALQEKALVVTIHE